MTDPVCPHLVYHCCAVNDYQAMVREQFLLVRKVGLAAALAAAGDVLRISHVGPDPDWIMAEAARQDIPARIVRTDLNISHYETFAMLEVDRLAKVEKTKRPILYFHTKGITCPGEGYKRTWRRLMEYHVLEQWRGRVGELILNDACGFNWWSSGKRHFSGNFWIASPDYIRRLPEYSIYHNAEGRSRFACEMWIGSVWPMRMMSCGCSDVMTWKPGFSWDWLIPPAPPPGPEITWFSAATPDYAAALATLEASAGRLGNGHQFRGTPLASEGVWRGSRKLVHLKWALQLCTTSHAFWIDADMEFLTSLLVEDLVSADRPLSVVRHIAYGRPRDHLPPEWAEKVVRNGPDYFSSCLFGGTVAAMRELVDKSLSHFGRDGGYDEHALVVEWDRLGPEVVRILPTRYSFPTSCGRLPQYAAEALRRSEGAARISHSCTDINR
jgi:hypothetical protein